MKLRNTRHHEAADALAEGQYTRVITLYADTLPADAAEWRLLGLAYLRSGRLIEAETPLLRASVLEDQEGQVEYGNLLRASGRFDEALTHFEAICPTLTGELQLRCLRWWGTAEFQSGDTAGGLARSEKAWYGYLALGDPTSIARITQTVAQMYFLERNLKRARHLYQEALYHLDNVADLSLQFGIYYGLTNVNMMDRRFQAAYKNIIKLKDLLNTIDYPIYRARLITVEAEYFREIGDSEMYVSCLNLLLPIAKDLQDYELRSWTAVRLAELYSSQGRHSQALEVLHDLSPTPDLPPALLATRGILMRRRGHFALAIEDLSAAIEELRGSDTKTLLRAQLHLADTLRRSGEDEEAGVVLREALSGLMQDRQRASYRADLEELRELTQHALLDPDTAPYMESVLDQLAILTNTQPIYEDTLMHLQVFTMGRSIVTKDGETIHLTLEGSALTLAYLTLHPNRTRAELQEALYPEKEQETGASYFRSVFRELRQKFGQHILLMEGSPRLPHYRLGAGVHIDLDVKELQEALARGEVARALALYRGPFLPQVEGSDWADDLRGELSLGLGLELRGRLDRAHADGDLKRALLLCNQYLRVDPLDREVLELRVELARQVAPAQELARYMVELQRYLN